MTANPAGWYTDPEGSGGQRYWDGERWTAFASSVPLDVPLPRRILHSARRHPRRVAAGLVAVVALLVGIVALGPTKTEERAPQAAGVTTPTTSEGLGPAPVVTMAPLAAGTDPLAGVVVAPEIETRPYDRDIFGYPKGGTDDRGCNTRARVLLRDSTSAATTTGSSCTVSAGTWTDAYLGTAVTDPQQLSVDHLVPLKEAWRSGASSWDTARLIAFGNDLAVGTLVLISGAGNSQKGDKDPANWMPPDPARYQKYAELWLAVKHRWGLAADQAEIDALRSILHPAPTPSSAPQSLVSKPPDQPPTTASDSTPSSGRSFSTCAEARAAGAAPLHRGEPGYSSSLDRDGDGTACE